jgi:hypothetical protein
MRPRDQPPQHWPEIWRLIERMSAEDFRAFFIQGANGLTHLRYGFPHLAYSFARSAISWDWRSGKDTSF